MGVATGRRIMQTARRQMEDGLVIPVIGFSEDSPLVVVIMSQGGEGGGITCLAELTQRNIRDKMIRETRCLMANRPRCAVS